MVRNRKALSLEGVGIGRFHPRSSTLPARSGPGVPGGGDPEDDPAGRARFPASDPDQVAGPEFDLHAGQPVCQPAHLRLMSHQHHLAGDAQLVEGLEQPGGTDLRLELLERLDLDREARRVDDEPGRILGAGVGAGETRSGRQPSRASRSPSSRRACSPRAVSRRRASSCGSGAASPWRRRSRTSDTRFTRVSLVRIDQDQCRESQVRHHDREAMRLVSTTFTRPVRGGIRVGNSGGASRDSSRTSRADLRSTGRGGLRPPSVVYRLISQSFVSTSPRVPIDGSTTLPSMNSRFLDTLRDRVLIYDGAMGTQIQARSSPPRTSAASAPRAATTTSR